jgi:hypothetical protein
MIVRNCTTMLILLDQLVGRQKDSRFLLFLDISEAFLAFW